MPRALLCDSGVYLPHSLRADALFFTAVLALIGTMVVLHKVSWGAGLAWSLLFVAAPAWRQAREYRRYGARGRPMIAIDQDELVIERPFDTRAAVRMALPALQRVVVYGPRGRRTLRLVPLAGKPTDVVPMWGRRVEELAIRFLLQALPDRTVVEEPQTLMAAARRDGPETDT